MPDQQPPTPIAQVYLERIARFGDAQRQLDWQLRCVSIALWMALAAAGGLAALLVLRYATPGLWAADAVLLGVSILLVVGRTKLAERMHRAEQLRIVNELSLARVQRRWDDVDAKEATVPGNFDEIASDLEVFGYASLFRLLNTAETTDGIATLARWLAEPAPPQLVEQRQETVAALAGQLDRRQEFQAQARLLIYKGAQPARFLRWAESERPRFFGHLTVGFSRLSAGFSLLSIVAFVMGAISADVAGGAMLAVAVVNLFVTAGLGGRVFDNFRAVASGASEASRFHGLFRLAATFPVNSAIMERIASQMTDAVQESKKLERIATLTLLRKCLPLYAPLQFLFLWDLHVLALMERWKSQASGRCRGWFEAVGELEALACFAGVKHDNPDWAFPVVRSGNSFVIESQDLGHPLLADDVRVANDVTVGPPGEILMVTGSNMSGKSTLLRSLGTNIVLAQAGAPVCARRMALPPLELVTVMRVSDSLERGMSLFMAELVRLRHVVGRADAATSNSGRQVCYLLDEILHGTNSAERHIAAAHILKRLADAGALGAVSTHDLALCDEPAIMSRCRNVHFCESIRKNGEQVEMTFDYRLRPGMATTTNVAYLLDAVGLPLNPLFDHFRIECFPGLE
ncbi:MAG TPA: hypothetical protein VGX78_11745 [Pirellulales bacterium]|nr:hypothetical protein [Pirellulales bacterium]